MEKELQFLMDYYELLGKRGNKEQKLLDQLDKLVVAGELSQEISDTLRSFAHAAQKLSKQSYDQLAELAYEIGNKALVVPPNAGMKYKCDIVQKEEGDPCHPRVYYVCNNKHCKQTSCPMHMERRRY